MQWALVRVLLTVSVKNILMTKRWLWKAKLGAQKVSSTLHIVPTLPKKGFRRFFVGFVLCFSAGEIAAYDPTTMIPQSDNHPIYGAKGHPDLELYYQQRKAAEAAKNSKKSKKQMKDFMSMT